MTTFWVMSIFSVLIPIIALLIGIRDALVEIARKL